LPGRGIEKIKMRGSYILLVEIPGCRKIGIGKLGMISFGKGVYAYTGSGMKNLEKRVERHFKKEKKLHWHIDYLLQQANPLTAWIFESEKREECKLAKYLAENNPSIKGFGSSDCSCESHLFFIKDQAQITRLVSKMNGKRYR
jgi:Uri superfamily endonuclease